MWDVAKGRRRRWLSAVCDERQRVDEWLTARHFSLEHRNRCSLFRVLDRDHQMLTNRPTSLPTKSPIRNNPLHCYWLHIERQHFQWPWTTATPGLRSRHSLTLNISETVQDTSYTPFFATDRVRNELMPVFKKFRARLSYGSKKLGVTA